MAEPFTLVVDADRRPEQVADMVLDLARDLDRRDGLQVQHNARAPRPGERAADVGLTGQLLLTFLTSGAATVLIECLRSYVARDRTLRFRFRKADGTELEIEGKHLDEQALDRTLESIKRFAET